MIKLISLTDFSKVSKNAFKYACELTSDLQGSLSVRHYYQHIRTTGHFKSMRDILLKDAEKDMKSMMIEAECTMTQKGEMQSKVLEGDVITGLQSLKDNHDHLVVIGSLGATNKLKSIFGSTTRALINRVRLPVLIIPPHSHYKKPQVIVVANDGQMTESNLRYLDFVANKLEAHLYFLHVGKLDIEHESIDRYGTYLETSTYSFHNVDAENIIVGVNNFARSVQAEMIVMAKNKQNLLQKVFGTSHTNEEVVHLITPLLVLHRNR